MYEYAASSVFVCSLGVLLYRAVSIMCLLAVISNGVQIWYVCKCYVYICNNAHIYVCIIYIYIHMYVFTCTHANTHMYQTMGSPVYLFVCLSVCRSICLSLYVPICLSIRLSVYLSIHSPVLSIYVSEYLCTYDFELASQPAS